MKAAEAAPLDAACAAQDVDVGDEPPPPPKPGRPKKKRIMRAAQAAPQDAACAAPDVDVEDEPPPKPHSLGIVAERDRTHQQYSDDEENMQIPQAAQLNAQTALLLLDIGDWE